MRVHQSMHKLRFQRVLCIDVAVFPTLGNMTSQCRNGEAEDMAGVRATYPKREFCRDQGGGLTAAGKSMRLIGAAGRSLAPR